MKSIYPEKLKKGGEVRVVTPSDSLHPIASNIKQIAKERFEALGLKVSFGKYVEEMDKFESSGIKSRVSDLHDAFRDENVKAVIAGIGGYNANQLLGYLDWGLIRKNPKIFLGFSDTTVLQNAMYAKSGLVTYSGPMYAIFGEKYHFDYSLEYFKKCVMDEGEFQIHASDSWSDDGWFRDQEQRNLIKNDGFVPINNGEANGMILGGNLCTLNLLWGTEYAPDISESILFLEDDSESDIYTFDRNLQSLLHHPDFHTVQAVVIGRFQPGSKVTTKQLKKVIETKKELEGIPVLLNVDFGHTDPLITFPIGGEASVLVSENDSQLKIVKH